jgi:hypothetical protein
VTACCLDMQAAPADLSSCPDATPLSALSLCSCNIAVVDTFWLDECLEAWDYVPEGPFLLTLGALEQPAQAAAAVEL